MSLIRLRPLEEPELPPQSAHAAPRPETASNPVQRAWTASLDRHLRELTGRQWEQADARKRKKEASRRALKTLQRRIGRPAAERTVRQWRRNGTTTVPEGDQRLAKWAVVDDHGGVERTASARGVSEYAVRMWLHDPQRTTPPWQHPPPPRWTEPVNVQIDFSITFIGDNSTPDPVNRSTEKRLNADEANEIALPLDGEGRPNDPDVVEALEKLLLKKWLGRGWTREQFSIYRVENLVYS